MIFTGSATDDGNNECIERLVVRVRLVLQDSIHGQLRPVQVYDTTRELEQPDTTRFIVFHLNELEIHTDRFQKLFVDHLDAGCACVAGMISLDDLVRARSLLRKI